MSRTVIKKLFLVSALVLPAVLAPAAQKKPEPVPELFLNNSPLSEPPQVNAKIFWNRSVMDFSTAFMSRPYQAQNVQFWTNSGVMNNLIGWQFEYDLDGKKGRRVRANRNLQRPSDTFYNSGNISGSSFLSVNARAIANPGRLDTLEAGRILILATNGIADLSRGTLRVGPSTVPICDFPPFLDETNFTPNPNITDLYWGAGRNNALGTNGAVLNLTTLPGGLTLPFPSTPAHQVRVRGSSFTNTVILPSFNGCAGLYDVFVHTNAMSDTGMLVSIVFVPTNNTAEPTNLAVDVRFTPIFDRNDQLVYAPIVQFHSTDFDIVEQQHVDNFVTFMDSSAAETNITLARPFLTTGGTGNTRRPSTYNIVRGRACNFDFAEASNSVYDPTLFYRTTYETTRVSTIYAAYSAQVGQTNSAAIAQALPIVTGGVLTSGLGVNPAVSDPTNFAGRAEINANNLDLTFTRIRAENFVSIKANNLTSNLFAQIDAPFVDFQVKSTNPELIIQNIAPESVNRLQGTVSAWSSVWNVNETNTVVTPNATNTTLRLIRFHVLVVDDCLRSTTPVTLNRFSVTAPSLIIRDKILVNGTARVDAQTLVVATNATLGLPLGADLAFTNVHDLLNFTNNGTVSVQGGAYLGTFDTGHLTPRQLRRKKKKKQIPAPLDSFANHGALGAAALFVRATNAEISSGTVVPSVINAGEGVISVVADTIVVSNATLVAGSDLELHANTLQVAQSELNAGRVVTNFVGTNLILRPIRGTIVLDATNSFGDFEGVSTNLWQATGGIKVPTEPFELGDLMGTHVYLSGGTFWISPVVWAGQDRGPTVDGFANNLALSKLTLDGAAGNLFHFSAAGISNAIYVDYLELLNDATNFNFALGVDSNFTIYFADSNISAEKLDETTQGRVRWVSDFTGPNSSTNITYPNGVTYTFNAALVRSRDLDSDGDGIVNALDCTPVAVTGFDSTQPCAGFAPLAKSVAYSADAIALSIALEKEAGQVRLEWDAAAGSANTVEFTDSLAGGAWQTLTNFINGPVNARVTVKDAAGAPLRVYRVRVDAGKP